MNAVFVYDFTLGDSFADVEDVKSWLREHCKKWCFQHEVSEETGYPHYQGRFSLKTKLRLTTLKNKMPWKEIHLSPTSRENADNDFYVSKEESRIDGPWKDTDRVIYIPKHFRVVGANGFLPFQQSIIDIMNTEPGRSVHCIIDNKTNQGKSTFVGFLCCQDLATKITGFNEYRDIMRMVMDTREVKKVNTYFVDMPKATVGISKMRQLFMGIETVKDGHCYDDRNRYREEWFDQPHVFVFTNDWPDISHLAKDRWKFWCINDNKELVEVPHPSTVQVDVPSVTMALPQQIATQALDTLYSTENNPGAWIYQSTGPRLDYRPVQDVPPVPQLSCDEINSHFRLKIEEWTARELQAQKARSDPLSLSASTDSLYKI